MNHLPMALGYDFIRQGAALPSRRAQRRHPSSLRNIPDVSKGVSWIFSAKPSEKFYSVTTNIRVLQNQIQLEDPGSLHILRETHASMVQA